MSVVLKGLCWHHVILWTQGSGEVLPHIYNLLFYFPRQGLIAVSETIANRYQYTKGQVAFTYSFRKKLAINVSQCNSNHGMHYNLQFVPNYMLYSTLIPMCFAESKPGLVWKLWVGKVKKQSEAVMVYHTQILDGKSVERRICWVSISQWITVFQ